MAFDWGTAISVGGSLLGGVMGGSKAGERAAKDAAARAANAQETAQRQSQANMAPYLESGQGATKLLSQYLGTADPEGYAPRPTRQQFEDELRNEHFQWAGKDYNRNSNMASVNQRIDQRYRDAMAKWEAGKSDYLAANPEAGGDGRLLREFSNADFVRDPGYNFRMAEGEKGINRALSARGGYDSGAALKSLNRYNQDFASNEFGNAFNRDAANKQSIYQMLSGQSAQGLGAATAQGNAAMGAATNIGNIGMNQANNSWQAGVNRSENQANAVQSALGNLVYGIRRGNQSVVSSPTFGQTSAIQGAYYA